MAQQKSKSYWGSVFGFNCPRCRKGRLFSGPIGLKTTLDMPKRCSECDLNFEPEPGYYYGAMFVSYILMGWFSLAVIGVCILIFKWSIGASFALLAAILAVGFFWNLRFSRSMYIHLNTKYDETAITKFQAELNTSV